MFTLVLRESTEFLDAETSTHGIQSLNSPGFHSVSTSEKIFRWRGSRLKNNFPIMYSGIATRGNRWMTFMWTQTPERTANTNPGRERTKNLKWFEFSDSVLRNRHSFIVLGLLMQNAEPVFSKGRELFCPSGTFYFVSKTGFLFIEVPTFDSEGRSNYRTWAWLPQTHFFFWSFSYNLD